MIASIAPQVTYDGTVLSLADGIADRLDAEVPCAMLRKNPDLLAVIESRWGSSRDASLPRTDCDLQRRFPVPASIEPYIELAKLPARDFLGTYGGTAVHTHARQEYIQDIKTHLFPLLLIKPVKPFFEYDYWRANMPDWLPFEGWSYLSLDNRRTFIKVAAAYRTARTDLARHFRLRFGLSPPVAATAARRALQFYAYEGHWSRPDRSGLRHLILSGASETRITAMLARGPVDIHFVAKKLPTR